jgi:hypothetical protein
MLAGHPASAAADYIETQTRGELFRRHAGGDHPVEECVRVIGVYVCSPRCDFSSVHSPRQAVDLGHADRRGVRPTSQLQQMPRAVSQQLRQMAERESARPQRGELLVHRGRVHNGVVCPDRGVDRQDPPLGAGADARLPLGEHLRDDCARDVAGSGHSLVTDARSAQREQVSAHS